MQETKSKTDSSDEMPSIWELMVQSGLLHKGDPTLISTGKPPYRIHYPLEGFTSLYETKSPPEVKQRVVPAVLNVKLSGRSTEASGKSSATKIPTPSAPSPTPSAPATSNAPSPAPAPSSNTTTATTTTTTTTNSATTTPQAAPPAPSQPSSSGTVVQLPPKKKKQADPPKPTADDLLKKIPDLSFMLSSKLSLPAQS